jgi:ribosome recycling factor
MQIPISSRDRRKTKSLVEPRSRFLSKFQPAIEFRLDVAVEMVKEGRGVKYAVRSIQKRILDRLTAKEKEEELEEESGNKS